MAVLKSLLLSLEHLKWICLSQAEHVIDLLRRVICLGHSGHAAPGFGGTSPASRISRTRECDDEGYFGDMPTGECRGLMCRDSID